jgi:N-formylglutamate amidohydrolase
MGERNNPENLAQDIEPSVLWHVQRAESPLCALAVHAGHGMRPELIPYLAIDEVTRIREEDPYTDYWASLFGNHILTRRSRFEIDLNRPLDEAICVQPEDCWNLNVWKTHVPEQMYRTSFAEHGLFYKMLRGVLSQLEQEFGRFVVLDFHSYNHRRTGPNGLPAQQETNPDINIGTGSMDRALWAPVVDGFVEALRGFDFDGHGLDVRENINFRGRYVSEFVHKNFPKSGCALAIEVKKFFMNEWSGVADASAIRLLADCFLSASPVLVDTLKEVQS